MGSKYLYGITRGYVFIVGWGKDKLVDEYAEITSQSRFFVIKSGALNAQFLHFRLQCGPFEPQNPGSRSFA